VEEGEDCDDGGLNSDVEPDSCRTTCQLPGCGDGTVDTGEVCDDGNVLDGDTCSADCQVSASDPISGTLVISEIMKNPKAVGDSLGEWVEVYNPTSVTFDLKGWSIWDEDTDFHVIETSVALPPGEFVLLGNNGDISTNGGVSLDYEYDGIVLANSADEVVLAVGDVVIDSVAYDSALGFPATEGKSMSLGSALDAATNDLPESWCVGVASFGAGDLGSPGNANPPCPSDP